MHNSDVVVVVCVAAVSVSIFNLCLTLTSPLLMTLSKLLGIPVNYGKLSQWLARHAVSGSVDKIYVVSH